MQTSMHVIEITTEVYHLVQRRAPVFVSWTEQIPGPTQRIVVDDEVYKEFVDRAIAKRKTLDEVVRDACTETGRQRARGMDSLRNN